MGVRAVIIVNDESGHCRRFWAAWASKQYQIPHLARLVHTADHSCLPLNLDGYLAYTAAHPGALPTLDVTDDGRYADPAGASDLDHRYELQLRQSDRTFCYLVYDRVRNSEALGWRRTEALATRAQLYEAAARMCRALAAGTPRFAERNGGAIPTGWPTAQRWQNEADTFTTWLADTKGNLLQRSFHQTGSAAQAVPDWFAVRAARGQARHIGAVLRQHYPGERIRSRVGADGTISLTIPGHLATDTDTARIATILGDLLERRFTVTVRQHRRSRYSATQPQAAPAQANATVTLRSHEDGNATSTSARTPPSRSTPEISGSTANA